MASAFSGLLAAAILKMQGVGNKPGWAWLFILVRPSAISRTAGLRTDNHVQEGLFTVLFGVSCYWLLPNTPTALSFLNKEERQFVLHALHEDGIISGDEKDETYTKDNFIRTFLQPHVILVMIIGFMNGTSALEPASASASDLRFAGSTLSGLA